MMSFIVHISVVIGLLACFYFFVADNSYIVDNNPRHTIRLNLIFLYNPTNILHERTCTAFGFFLQPRDVYFFGEFIFYVEKDGFEGIL